MRLCFFDTKPYDREFFDRENEKHGYEIIYHEEKLNPSTAVIAAGCDAACAFVFFCRKCAFLFARNVL